MSFHSSNLTSRTLLERRHIVWPLVVCIRLLGNWDTAPVNYYKYYQVLARLHNSSVTTLSLRSLLLMLPQSLF
jgi:hypothetical protein